MGGVASGNFSGDVDFSSTTDGTLGNPDTGAVQFNGVIGIGRDQRLVVDSTFGNLHLLVLLTSKVEQLILANGDTDNVVLLVKLYQILFLMMMVSMSWN